MHDIVRSGVQTPAAKKIYIMFTERGKNYIYMRYNLLFNYCIWELVKIYIIVKNGLINVQVPKLIRNF